MTAIAERTALAPVDTESTSMVVMPAANPRELVEAMRAYEETVKAILDDSDYQNVRGKRFKKRSGLTKLAIAYAASTEILAVEKERNEEGTCIYAEATVRATAPNGRFADGWGACSIRESRFNGKDAHVARQKADHDIPATATTRAQNRACANLFGNGEVSAEEASGSDVVDAEVVDERTQLLTRLKGYGENGLADMIRATCRELTGKDTKVTALPIEQLRKVAMLCEQAAKSQASEARGRTEHQELEDQILSHVQQRADSSVSNAIVQWASDQSSDLGDALEMADIGLLRDFVEQLEAEPKQTTLTD